MSEKYNDDYVKEILESEKIPERLEPDNIKEMLDNSNALKKRRKIRRGKALRIVSAAAAFAIVVSTSLYFMKPLYYNRFIKDESVDNKPASFAVSSMTAAADYGDIYSFFFAASAVNRFKDNFFTFTNGDLNRKEVEFDTIAESYEDEMVYGNGNYAEDGIVGEENNADIPSAESSSMAAADISSAQNSLMKDVGVGDEENEYSDTYSQETGVLEADIVKTDGKNIFYSYNDELYIAKTDKGRFEDHYKTDVTNLLGVSDDKYIAAIEDMYIYNNKLILISSVWEPEDNIAVYDDVMYDTCYPYLSNADTYVMIVNIADRITLDGYYVQEGYYSDVRLMSDGYLYVISNDEKYLDFNKTGKDDIGNYIPEYCVDGENCYVKPDDIMIPAERFSDIYDYVSYTNVTGLNLNGEIPWDPVDMKSIAGYTNNLYCSQQNLYVVSGYDESEITRFLISEGTIMIQASGKVNGYVNDQFSMSEYNGYFRIAVTENVNDTENKRRWFGWNSGSTTDSATMIYRKNSVYIFDMSMNIVGSISDFGLNEQIKSVNFNGDKAYVVTFRNTDPLYAIDLSDPSDPKMLDELKISGYSSYMQQWGEGLILGFGAEADVDSGGETGIKLTMFDNSDPENLKAIDSVSITQTEESYVYSEGLYERKALYIDPERNIIGFPMERFIYTETEDFQDSYEFYSYENGRFVYKGSIKYGTEEYRCANYCFVRVVYIDGYLYAVSSSEFRSADAVTFEEVDKAVF